MHVGSVTDHKAQRFIGGIDMEVWQKRRIYSDEVNYASNEILDSIRMRAVFNTHQDKILDNVFNENTTLKCLKRNNVILTNIHT